MYEPVGEAREDSVFDASTQRKPNQRHQASHSDGTALRQLVDGWQNILQHNGQCNEDSSFCENPSLKYRVSCADLISLRQYYLVQVRWVDDTRYSRPLSRVSFSQLPMIPRVG